MDLILKSNLITVEGERLPAEKLLDDKTLVCLFFSAHWCPPCRQFTPILATFYEEMRNEGLEVVFVSSDRSPSEMAQFRRALHGPWPAIEHESESAQALKKRFGVTNIPTVIVLKKSDGAVVSREGRMDIQTKGPGALKEWRKKL